MTKTIQKSQKTPNTVSSTAQRTSHFSGQRRKRYLKSTSDYDNAFSRENNEAIGNNNSIPDQKLKTGIENLSGIDLSDVKVHRSSLRPRQLDALPTPRKRIYMSHRDKINFFHTSLVVQQKQGRVYPTAKLGKRSNKQVMTHSRKKRQKWK